VGNSVSIQNMLSSVLGVFNIEQSQNYPPAIYQAHYNTVTSFLLSKLAAMYPDSQDAIDMIDPFVEQQLIPVTSGYIQLPGNYRNMLGNPSIAAKLDGSGECSDLPITVTDFKTTVEKGKCKRNPLIIVPESEWALRTRSTYDFPTVENPIGYYIGKKQIKVCPYDISKVLVTYARNEKEIIVKYIMQPDDTYLIDEDASTKPEWSNNAFAPIFKGICALYSAYSRDPNLKEWSAILNQIGLV
jgi:hypothetical protein